MKAKPCPISVALVGILSSILVVGCVANRATNVKNTITTASNNVEKTDAHLQSAQRLLDQARKTKGETQGVLLDNTKTEVGDARDSNKDTRSDLLKVQGERDKLLDINGKQSDELTKIKAGWGYKLQRGVERFWFWIKVVGLTWVIAHIGFGVAGLVIQGPLGAAFASIGAFLNPLTWWQVIRDNIHFNGELKKAKQKQK